MDAKKAAEAAKHDDEEEEEEENAPPPAKGAPAGKAPTKSPMPGGGQLPSPFNRPAGAPAPPNQVGKDGKPIVVYVPMSALGRGGAAGGAAPKKKKAKKAKAGPLPAMPNEFYMPSAFVIHGPASVPLIVPVESTYPEGKMAKDPLSMAKAPAAPQRGFCAKHSKGGIGFVKAPTIKAPKENAVNGTLTTILNDVPAFFADKGPVSAAPMGGQNDFAAKIGDSVPVTGYLQFNGAGYPEFVRCAVNSKAPFNPPNTVLGACVRNRVTGCLFFVPACENSPAIKNIPGLDKVTMEIKAVVLRDDTGLMYPDTTATKITPKTVGFIVIPGEGQLPIYVHDLLAKQNENKEALEKAISEEDKKNEHLKDQERQELTEAQKEQEALINAREKILSNKIALMQPENVEERNKAIADLENREKFLEEENKKLNPNDEKYKKNMEELEKLKKTLNELRNVGKGGSDVPDIDIDAEYQRFLVDRSVCVARKGVHHE